MFSNAYPWEIESNDLVNFTNVDNGDNNSARMYTILTDQPFA